MSTPVTVEELYGLESWAKSNAQSGPEFSKALTAFVSLRDLMSQQLSQKNLLKYLHRIECSSCSACSALLKSVSSLRLGQPAILFDSD